MKKTLKSILIFLLCCSWIFLFASCEKGIDRNEADLFVENFLSAVAAEDYESATTFLHPDRPADLETFFLNIEQKEGIDFGEGIEIEKRTGFSSSYYDSTVGGSRYQPTMRIKVGDHTAKIVIEIVKNENGYGIYNLDINT